MKYLGLIIFTLSLLYLSGCSVLKVEPETVMTRFSKAMAELNSFRYSGTLNLAGNIPSSLSHNVRTADFKVSGEVEANNPQSPNFSMNVGLTADAEEGRIRLGGEIISVSDYTYFRVSDFSLPSLLPISLAADAKWYRMKHPTPAEAGSNKLGAIDVSQLDPAKVTRVKEVLSRANIFEILEVYPEESVNGVRSYHFKVKVLPQMVSALYSDLRDIVPSLKTPADISELERYEIHLWINKRNYTLSQLQLTDQYFADGVPINFTLDLDITNPNTKVQISAPVSSQELESSKLKELPGRH